MTRITSLLLALCVSAIPAQTIVPDANHLVMGTGPIAVPGPMGSALAPGGYFDDFNRPDGTDMGPEWSEINGDMAIMNGAGMGTLTSGWSYMIHNLASGSLAQNPMQIDLLPPSGTSGPHVALITGVGPGSTQWSYTKIQDNNSDGTYDRVYFYSAGNGSGWGSSSVALTPFATGHVMMSLDPTGDTLTVDIDWNFDGIVDESVSNSGFLNLTLAGTGFGIGTWAMGSYDNWQVGTPILTPQVTSVGTGGTTSLGVATLSTIDLPFLGNFAFTATITNGVPSSSAYLFLSVGVAQNPQPLGLGNYLYLDPTSFVLLYNLGISPMGPLPTSAAGSTAFVLGIPSDPGYAGANVALQAAILAPASPIGVVTTNALDLILN